jgi:diacylglycerol kinase family enzyme
VGAILVVNPRASNVSEEIVERVLDELPGDVSVLRTEERGEATAIACEHEATADALYVLGGDGTYNEVLNGVTGRAPLGFLPGGGTSVLPRALGLGRDPVVAARLVAAGVARPIGLGRINGRRFAFNAGVGFDAELVRRIDELGRADDGRRPGDAAFVRAAIGMVAARRGRFTEVLEIEGVGRAAFALIANCSPYTYAGRMPVRVARGASFDGGLDVVAPQGVRPAGLPRLLVELARGATARNGLTVLHDIDRISLRCDGPMPLQVDGEDLGDTTDVVLEAERAAVRAFVPG